MNPMFEYRQKIVSAEEAVSRVQSGKKIYTSGNAATPQLLLDALALRKDELKNIEIYHLLLLGKDALSQPDMVGHFRHKSLFVGPADRAAVNEGHADYLPVFLFDIPNLIRHQIKPEIAFVHTSPPDKHGFVSLGVEIAATKAAIETADLVVVLVNEKMPRSRGDSYVHISQIDYIVECSENLPVIPPEQATEVEEKIATSIMPLIEDGATLQLGIGGIPNAVLAQLTSKKDLGIHTEMVSDSVVTAIEAGIVTNMRKQLNVGKVVATFTLGTQDLYQYIHENPRFEMHPVDYTNNQFVIAKHNNFVAINSALEIDLTGQVCSDSIGFSIFSGFGGQVDFIRGASRSMNGRPIIALPATARKGAVSRIVPYLRPGAGVVTSRADVHYVITEFGTAYLHGKTLRERAEALIQIAHPDFRQELESFAISHKLL